MAKKIKQKAKAKKSTNGATLRLRRRPITHVVRLESPILLMHGSNDSRVQVSESRQEGLEAGTRGGSWCRPLRAGNQDHGGEQQEA